MNEYNIILQPQLTKEICKNWQEREWQVADILMDTYMVIVLDADNMPVGDIRILSILEEKGDIRRHSKKEEHIVKIVSGYDDLPMWDCFTTNAPYSYIASLLRKQLKAEAEDENYLWVDELSCKYSYELVGCYLNGNCFCEKEEEMPPCDILLKLSRV